MPKDDKSVQSEEVSQETESTETETQTTEKQTQGQPLTREDITRLVAEQVGQQTETARREIQSIKDKAKAEVEAAQRETRYHQGLATGLETGFGAEDPGQVELIKTKAELAARQRADVEERQRQYADGVSRAFKDNITQFITSAGLDPNDERIDWAEEIQGGDLLAKQQRILASVTKAQKEDAKTADDKRSQEFKDMEDRLRKDLGIDSVDTSASGGAGRTDWRKLSPEGQILEGLEEGTGKRRK